MRDASALHVDGLVFGLGMYLAVFAGIAFVLTVGALCDFLWAYISRRMRNILRNRSSR